MSVTRSTADAMNPDTMNTDSLNPDSLRPESLRPEVAAHLAHHGGMITAEKALDLGLDRRDITRLVRSGAWRRLRRGVYVSTADAGTANPYDREQRWRDDAIYLALGHHYVRSHQSAALVLGLPVLRAQRAHLTTQSRGCSRKEDDLTVHVAAFRASDIREVDGARCLSPSRTAVDIARDAGIRSGVVAVDSALRTGVSPDELEEQILFMRRWPGVRTAKSALELSDRGSESIGESLTRLMVIELGRGTPETQFGLTDGHRTGFADLRLGRHLIEFDGRSKYQTDPEAVHWDEKIRDDWWRGFHLGVSHVVWRDCFSGRREALARLEREYQTTTHRFGTSIEDLARFRVARRCAARRSEP